MNEGLIQESNQKRKEYVFKNIDSVNVCYNNVLIKPYIKNINKTTKSGIQLVAPSYKDQVDHVDRIGVVAKLSEKLFFNDEIIDVDIASQITTGTGDDLEYHIIHKTVKQRKYQNASLIADVDLELKEGDEVVFSFMSSLNSIIIKIQGEIYYLIRYEEIYAGKRNGKIFAINGNIIGEKVKRNVNKSIIKAINGNEIDNRYLLVKYVGKGLRQYLGGQYPPLNKIEVGDLIQKIDEKLTPDIESCYHTEFFGEQKNMVFIPKIFILSIYKKNIMTLDNLECNGERILILPEKAKEKTDGGLIIPDTIKEIQEFATVIKVGKGTEGEEIKVKKGDEVLFLKGMNIPITLEGKNYLMVRNQDILMYESK